MTFAPRPAAFMPFSTSRSRATRNSTVFSPTRREPASALGYHAIIIGAALALLLITAVAIALGPYRLAARDLVAFLVAKATGGASPLPLPAETVILQIRLPRVLAALAVGAALAASGAAYQSLFRNPLVSPDILGVSAGAAFGAVVGIFLSLPVLAIEAVSFAGGLAAVIIVYAIAAAIRGRDAGLVLVLAGVVIGGGVLRVGVFWVFVVVVVVGVVGLVGWDVRDILGHEAPNFALVVLVV